MSDSRRRPLRSPLKRSPLGGAKSPCALLVSMSRWVVLALGLWTWSGAVQGASPGEAENSFRGGDNCSVDGAAAGGLLPGRAGKGH
jgi:hypothetical protein